MSTYSENSTEVVGNTISTTEGTERKKVILITKPNNIIKPLSDKYKEKLENSRSRAWFLTINNPVQDEVNLLYQENTRYLVWQMEVGKKQTPHIHAVLYYTNPVVWPKKRFPRARIEIPYNLSKTINYCMKERTRTQGPYEVGEKPSQGERTDFNNIKEAFESGATLQDIAKTHSGHFVRYHRGLEKLYQVFEPKSNIKPHVIWIYGDSGCGKTHWAKNYSGSYYIKGSGIGWENYNNEETIIFDNFDGKYDFKEFLHVLEGNEYRGKILFGTVLLRSKNIIITSLNHPSTFYEGEKLNQVLYRLHQVIYKVKPTTFERTLPKEYILHEEDQLILKDPVDKPAITNAPNQALDASVKPKEVLTAYQSSIFKKALMAMKTEEIKEIKEIN